MLLPPPRLLAAARALLAMLAFLLAVLSPALVALMALAASGCSASRAPGQLGHASFVYEGCDHDCDVLGNRLAAGGAHAIIDIDLQAGYRLASVGSSDPSVATFTLATSDAGPAVEAVSGHQGRTELRLYDPTGALIDEIGIGVAATAHLGYDAVSTYGGGVAVLEGGAQAFAVTTQDERGQVTLGRGSVRFAVDGPLIAGGSPPPLSPSSAASDAVAFTAAAPGAGLVHAFVDGGVTVSLPVRVVAGSELSQLYGVVGANSGDGNDVFANVDVIARTEETPVYGAACTWTVDAPATVDAQTVRSFDLPAGSSTRFRLPAPGSYLAKCAIGGLTTTLTLRR